MQKVKWLFFGYLGLVLLVIAGIALSFITTPPRDFYTSYTSLSANIKSLDPAEIGDTESNAVAGCLFECLYNYKYNTIPYTLIPEIASALPQVSKDGLTLTIPLKSGIHFYDPLKEVFHDGVGPEITAADIVYSWKRVCNFHLGITANYAGIFQGHIVGLDDWYDYTQSCSTPEQIDWNRPVAGLAAPDAHTLVIRLTSPDPQLRFNLAQIPTAPVCRQVVDYYKDKFRVHPVGSGAYAMTEYLPEQRIVFQANPVYRGGPDVQSGQAIPDDQRLPHIKRVQWGYYDEDLPLWFTFREGLLDASGIPKDVFSSAIRAGGNLTPAMEKDGIRLMKASEPDIFYIGFNMVDPVVGKNRPLRQAMSMAFDRKSYIDIYLNGRGSPAIGSIPPGFPTFDPNLANPYTQFNLAAARQKMIEAEKLNGGPIPPLNYVIGATDTTARQMTEYFVAQMAQIGLTLKPQYTTWARFLQMVDGKQAQVFDLGWDADYPDEQDFWQLFYSRNAGPGGINSVNYSNPQFDALYDQSSVMEPGPQRDVLYRKMNTIIMEDCPAIFTNYVVAYELYHDWLHNLAVMNYAHGMRAQTEIDFQARSAWLKSH